MPIYTYRCENCGVQFERQQKFSDAPLKDCPECEETALRKVYMPVGIVFKGSGFYSTDNRSSSGAKRGLKSSEGEEKAESKNSETNSETKAETKTETKTEKTEAKSEKKSE